MERNIYMPPRDFHGNTRSSPNPCQSVDPLLLSALQDPMQRNFVLKVNEEVSKFMLNPNYRKFPFPPMPAFQRLVIHRIADYFRLNHSVGGYPQWPNRPVTLEKNRDSMIPALNLSALIEPVEQRQIPEIRKPIKILSKQRTDDTEDITKNAETPVVPPQQVQPITFVRRAKRKVIVTDTPFERVVDDAEEKIISEAIGEREKAYAEARARIFCQGEEEEEEEEDDNTVTL